MTEEAEPYRPPSSNIDEAVDTLPIEPPSEGRRLGRFPSTFRTR